MKPFKDAGLISGVALVLTGLMTIFDFYEPAALLALVSVVAALWAIADAIEDTPGGGE